MATANLRYNLPAHQDKNDAREPIVVVLLYMGIAGPTTLVSKTALRFLFLEAGTLRSDQSLRQPLTPYLWG